MYAPPPPPRPAALTCLQARQMMSVIVEDTQARDPARRFLLLSKGSDVRMFKLNVIETDSNGSSGVPAEVIAAQRDLIAVTKAQLMEMAEDGLRTLCFAYRIIPEATLKPWLERYEAHLSDLNQKRLKDAKLPNKIDETAAEMERHLLFQGATANEDKLQEQVPETIALLAQAGIKIYMCTGDKQETAINIGFAARMLSNEFVRIIVTSEELLSDRIQEEAARLRKQATEAAAAARGLPSATHREQSRWEPPEVPDSILETNARVKLRMYANVSRAKASKLQEFARPRALVVDEPVMNMVWPNVPALPKVTPATAREAYKETVGLIAKVVALQAALEAPAYVLYDDTTWRDAEAEVLKLAGGPGAPPLFDDAPERAKIASILKEARLPELLQPGGTKHLAEGLTAVLLVQKQLKELEDAATGSVPPEHHDEAEALRAQAARLAADLAPQMEAAYKTARACLVATGPGMQQDLLVIAESCRAVICCRCRPDQKKKMLELIRYNVGTARCLAVGDGANDVDMIQAANVGVGIIGPEGVQAANASDYAVGRFRFLSRLLLVHGRWNYNRMALLITYMFYKNVLYALTQYWYTLVAAWSGQKVRAGGDGRVGRGGSLQAVGERHGASPHWVHAGGAGAIYNRDCAAHSVCHTPSCYSLPPPLQFFIEAGSQTFNLIFSGLPILVAAVYDRDVSAAAAVAFPYLYSDGLFRRRLNLSVLVWWLATAVYEAALIFIFAYFGAYWASNKGTTPYVFEFGACLARNVSCGGWLKACAHPPIAVLLLGPSTVASPSSPSC